MPTVGFRFRAYADRQTLRALKAQLEAACEIYNTLRWADTYFHQRDGKGLTLTELRQLALDLRKQDEEYQQLYSQVVQQVASTRLGSASSMGLQDSRGKRNPISTTPWFIRRAVGGYWLGKLERVGIRRSSC